MAKHNRPTRPCFAAARPACGLLAAILFAAMALAGCAGSGARKSADAQKAYCRTRDAWTREGRVFRGLDTVLAVTATPLVPPVGRAYADAYAEAFGLEATDRTRMEQALLTENGLSFVLAAFTPDNTPGAFIGKNAVWRLYLDRNGHRVPAESIEPIGKKDAPARHFFPYITPFRSAFRVRFPAIYPETGPEPMDLIITGVAGSLTLSWEAGGISAP